MVIRKQFKFNASHIVRNCSSDRCKYSLHAHTYKVEIFFKSNTLDNAGMVLDFGLTKGTIKELINAFNNSYHYWYKESQGFKNIIHKNLNRYISLPVSPSAENYSIIFFYIIDKILQATEFNNGEGKIHLEKIRVHETRTGYAETNREDMLLIDFNLDDIIFSKHINMLFKDNWWENLINVNKNTNKKIFINDLVEQQIK